MSKIITLFADNLKEAGNSLVLSNRSSLPIEISAIKVLSSEVAGKITGMKDTTGTLGDIAVNSGSVNVYAEQYADAITALAEEITKAYADSIVTMEEERAIADATAKADEAERLAGLTAEAAKEAWSAEGATDDSDIRSTNPLELTKIDAGKIALSSRLQIGNLDGVSSFMFADSGELEFFYWDGTTHIPYKGVRRYVGGTAQNNKVVNIPGLFMSTPLVMVSPHQMVSSVGAYSGLDQTQRCQVLSLEEYATYKWRFTARADIVAGTGADILAVPDISEGAFVYKGFGGYGWVYTIKTDCLGALNTTPTSCTSVTVSGSMEGRAAFENAYLYVHVSVAIWLEVIGYPAVQIGSASYFTTHRSPIYCSGAFNGTIPTSDGTHQYRLYAIIGGNNYHVETMHLFCTMSNMLLSFTRGGGTTIPSGSLNWTAHGV